MSISGNSRISPAGTQCKLCFLMGLYCKVWCNLAVILSYSRIRILSLTRQIPALQLVGSRYLVRNFLLVRWKYVRRLCYTNRNINNAVFNPLIHIFVAALFVFFFSFFAQISWKRIFKGSNSQDSGYPHNGVGYKRGVTKCMHRSAPYRTR